MRNSFFFFIYSFIAYFCLSGMKRWMVNGRLLKSLTLPVRQHQAVASGNVPWSITLIIRASGSHPWLTTPTTRWVCEDNWLFSLRRCLSLSSNLCYPFAQGVWKPRKIANPAFFEDLHPFRMTPFNAVGLELWSMSSDIFFDNFFITNDRNTADRWANDGWGLKRAAESAAEVSSKFFFSFFFLSKMHLRIAMLNKL